MSAEEIAWLIAALLRLSEHPSLMLPVISDHPFDAASNAAQKAFLRPVETVPRILQNTLGKSERIESSEIQWVKRVWPRTANLLKSCPPLNLALRAADACTIKGKPASALLMAWGALEELFAPSRNELRFRVSAQIAAYLEPIGPNRLELFKSIADLYNARSKVAHTAQEAKADALLQSFVILRNALIKMIDRGTVPTQKDLEKLLFCGDLMHVAAVSK